MVDEETKDKPTPEDTGEGVQSEADKKVAVLNADTERINQAIAENENAKARQKIAGVSDAGQPKPTEEEEKKAEAQKLSDEIVNAFK